MYYGYTEKVKKANLQEVRYQSQTLQSSKYSLNKLEKSWRKARWGCNGTKEGFRGTFTQDQQEVLRVLQQRHIFWTTSRCLILASET